MAITRSAQTVQKIVTTGEDGIRYENTFWDDIRVDASATRVNPSTSKPDFGAFPAGATYTKTLLFDGSARETVTFSVQLPHGILQTADLHPHVHWAATSVEVSKTVIWELNYVLANINGVFGAEVPITGTWGADDTVANKHILTSTTAIAGSALTGVSTMLICALSRRGDTDTYTGDVAFLEFDIHAEFGQPGSRQEYLY